MRNLRPVLKPFFKNSDETLSKKDFKRVTFFSIYIPVMLGYGFSLLREKSLSKEERLIMMLFSAATPLFDDFFDDEKLHSDDLENYFSLRENYQPVNSKQKLLFELLMKLKPLLQQPEQFVALCFQIFEAQKMAMQQKTNTGISRAEIKKLSFDKCGLSGILFWSILKNGFTKEEYNTIFQTGILIQFTDDIFDLWFDLQDGTQTLATTAPTIYQLEEEYEQEFTALTAFANKTSASKKSVQQFLAVQYFFFSRTFVVLEQLHQLQKSTDEIFQPKKFSRLQLVCDMAKWKNNWRWIQFAYQHKTTKPN